LSTFSSFKGAEWNYRIIATRTILIKAKNDQMRKAVAVDLSANLPFAFGFPEVPTEKIEVEKKSLATLKVFTSKNVQDVDSEFIEFFEVLDVDQSFEDFVKAYQKYPNHVAFEITQIEPL
jgi:hypothetical protein